MKTKEKIILTAIQQFNRHGISSTTSRHLATEIGIAYGNLTYHFKNKETLIIAIYDRMRKDMSHSYLSSDQYSSSLEHFQHLVMELEAFQYKYRFFNLDVLEISRSFPKIKVLLSKTFELRKQQMSEVFERFISEEYLKEETLVNYNRLQHTIRMVITFWLSQREVLTHFNYTGDGDMTKHIWELLKPHLTTKGYQEYQRLIHENKTPSAKQTVS